MSRSDSEYPKQAVALITGGSKGIGLELARQFARNRHDLVLVARNEADLERAAQDLMAETGCRVTHFALDLSRPDAQQELAQRLESRAIQIDVLVNNAGSGDYGPFVESDPQRQLLMLQLNVLALTALTRQLLPAMVARGRGRILNVASLAAFFTGGPNWTAYVASKRYVLAFTRGVAKELSGTGVTMTALCPGPVATDFAADAGIEGSRLYRWLPKPSAAQVARAGYGATMRGRTQVVPGVLNRLVAWLGELPPRGIAQSVFSFLVGRPSASPGPLRRRS